MSVSFLREFHNHSIRHYQMEQHSSFPRRICAQDARTGNARPREASVSCGRSGLQSPVRSLTRSTARWRDTGRVDSWANFTPSRLCRGYFWLQISEFPQRASDARPRRQSSALEWHSQIAARLLQDFGPPLGFALRLLCAGNEHTPASN